MLAGDCRERALAAMDTVSVNGFRFAKPKSESSKETKALVRLNLPAAEHGVVHADPRACSCSVPEQVQLDQCCPRASFVCCCCCT